MMTMNEVSFLCDAIYRGSEIVEGAVSPNKLTALAELVLNTGWSVKGYAEICIDKLPRGERCQLQIDEERLRISSSRKDEGFESDSESSSTASGSLIEEAVCASPEIKVIKDHVLRLEKLIRQDSGIHHCAPKTSTDVGSASISSSSGAESEEDAPKRLESSPTSTAAGNANSSPKTSLQSDNGNSDNILLSDILFCHVMSHRPKLVIVVVKSVDSDLVAAHLFECLSQEAARTLYTCYYTVSNKYKLNRYRKSKRRLEGFATDEKALLDRIHVSIRNIKKKHFDEPANSNQFSKDNRTSYKFRADENQSNYTKAFRNMYNGDKTNINIIEIKDSHLPVRVPNGMLQRTDENGVTHIEIESAPCSLLNPIMENETVLRTTFDSQEVLSALDRLSIHSSNNPNSYLNFIGVTSSCPNSLIATSREIHGAGDKEKEKKIRQRQPPLLIRKDNFKKLDSLPRKEIRRKQERRNRSRSEERKDPEEIQELFDESKHDNDNTSKQKDRGGEIINKDDGQSAMNETMPNIDRQSRLRNTLKDKENRSRPISNHKKGPAPLPPAKNHSNNNVMLVPTKSGQEKSKSYYPKESHIVRGSKLVRIDYPIYPPWNMNSDINNNPKRLFYAHPGWISSHEYHSSRFVDRSHSSDLRKRSRSKSPARRPMAHRYIDVVSTFSLSQKIKDLSDNLIQSLKISSQVSSSPNFISDRESQERMTLQRDKKSSSESTKPNPDEAIRPVIKRGKKFEPNPDSKRVTFSAFATVQLMDS